ncbi:MAG TPA: hypothetical protein VLI93_15060 [Acetobacteraceae bacterium]|nr:hypothetical protein [Acetobacteraceae bacterium]
MGKWFPLLGLGFAVAGADKLLGLRAYDRLFAKFGWSEPARQLIGAGEFLGGVLVASNSMRHLGGTLLTAVSTAMLTAEVGGQQRDLALPRCILLLSAASALLPVPHRRPTSRPAPRHTQPQPPKHRAPSH